MLGNQLLLMRYLPLQFQVETRKKITDAIEEEMQQLKARTEVLHFGKTCTS